MEHEYAYTSKIGLKDLGSFKQIDSKKMSMSQATELEFLPYGSKWVSDWRRWQALKCDFIWNEKTQVLTITTVVHIKN